MLAVTIQEKLTTALSFRRNFATERVPYEESRLRGFAADLFWRDCLCAGSVRRKGGRENRIRRHQWGGFSP
jgi:hypothetical protein